MHPIRMVVPPRDATPGGRHEDSLSVRRTLPHRRVAAIGAWCLLDHLGDAHTRTDVMMQPAYPEAGMQSVMWPLSGLIRRRDSLGNDDLIRHGQLALTTSGTGLSVAEVGIDDPRGGRHTRRFLHGARLRAALPAAERHQAPSYQHVSDLPMIRTATMAVHVLMGALAGHPADASPARSFTPLLAADITLTTGTLRVDLDPDFEHGVLLVDGAVAVNGTPLEVGALGYVPVGTARIELATVVGAQLLLLGGPPFAEEFIQWWNVVAGSHEEAVAFRDDWCAGAPRFGVVPGADLREAAPPLPPGRLRPRRGSLRA